MIEVGIYFRDKLVDWATAPDAGGALLAARTMWDECKQPLQGYARLMHARFDGPCGKSWTVYRRP